MASRGASKTTGVCGGERSGADAVKTAATREPSLAKRGGGHADRSGRSWAEVVKSSSSDKRGSSSTSTSEWEFSQQEWPSLLNESSSNEKPLWADLFEEAEYDLDSQLLAQMEAREDRERGADQANLETFGAEAGGWSYEEQVAANESLEVVPPPPPADPAWTRTAETLSVEEQSFVTTAVWPSSGMLWGRCKCCDKWIMDAEHFERKQHKRRTNGWNGRGEHAAGGQPELTGDSGVPTNKTRGSACFAAAHRSPDVRVFYPTWCSTGDHVDGAFLIDSF